MTIADVQDAAGEKAVASLNAKGYHVSFVHCDTTNWESSVTAFKCASSFGPRETLDVAILNAGIEGDKGSLADQVLAAAEPSLGSDVVPLQPARRGTSVNFLGTYDGCWLALHYFRLPAKAGPANASKSLIMTGSLASYADMPTNTQIIMPRNVSITFPAEQLYTDAKPKLEFVVSSAASDIQQPA